MPILNIEIVGQLEEHLHSGLTQKLADTAAEVFKSPPHGTWVKIHFISEEHYAENEGSLKETYPVFITIVLAKPPVGPDLARQVQNLTISLAPVLGRKPGNIHIIIELPAAGRIAFGGKLMEP